MFLRTQLILILAIWMICCKTYSVKAQNSSCVIWREVKDYSNCMTEVIANLGPELARGISDFNLPPLDPYCYPNIYLKYDLPLFSIRLNISNYQIFDATKYQVQSVNVDPYNLTFNVKIKIPQVITKTDYKVLGKLLFLDVTGAGEFEGNSTDITALIMASGKNVTDENNVERVAVDKVRIQLRVGNIKVKMSSSTPKFRSVAQATQDLINSFSDTILTIANPLLEGIADYIAKDLISLILSSFTREEIVPSPNTGSE